MRWLREFLDRYRRRTLIGVGVVALATTAIIVGPLSADSAAGPASPSVALSAGQTASVTCAGPSVSVTPQSSTSLTVACASAPTTTTTVPPTTTTTVPPTTTTTVGGGSTYHALVGLYDNGDTAKTLGISHLQVSSDYGYGSTSCSYATSGAQAATSLGAQLMLAVGACTAAQDVSIGEELVAGGQPDTIIRPMWEPNQHQWYALWNETAYTPAQFKAEWITEVDAFRSVPGEDFTFDYDLAACSGQNASGRSNFDSFPGTAYVNYIGIDIYDTVGSVAGAQACITADAQYAQSVDLPMTIPEWGAGTTDDPAFVHQIYLDSNLPTFYEEALFSAPFYTADTEGSSLTNYPNMLAEYKTDFDPQ